MNERVLILEHHVEQVEGGHVTYHAGSFYNIEDPLRQELIDAKKAVPESEYEPGAQNTVPAEVLAVPEVPGESPEQVAFRLKVLNG
jgi:hypothetical protein